MARAKKNELSSFEDIALHLKEGLNNAVRRPSIHAYVPHEKQVEFHTSFRRGRLYIGGNRSGKTVGGIVEDVWWLLGQHPNIPTPEPPVRGRIVTVSYTEGVKQIIIPEIAKWLPPSALINGSWEDSYNNQDRQLTLDNGSTVELMSYDQKLEKFAGTSRHFTHFDEEPPKSIFDECRMRLLDTAGSWWLTMTPVEGMTWVYDQLYLPGKKGRDNIQVIEIDTSENPYISSVEIETVLEGLDQAERKARKEGKFVQLGGVVFKNFDPEAHTISLDRPPPLSWTHYCSLDHGYNNPTAWLWHAVTPGGSIITYDELYMNERTIDFFAEEIHKRNRLPGRRPPDVYVGDPAIKQRMANTGDSVQATYARAGIPVVLGNNDVDIGVNKMNKYFGAGKWAINDLACPNFIRELQRVRWKIYETAKMRHDNNPREEIHKKDDHAPDSARYFITLMPDLNLPKPNGIVQRVDDINRAVQQAMGPASYGNTMGDFRRVDTNLSRPSQSNTEWTVVDEHLGGLF